MPVTRVTCVPLVVIALTVAAADTAGADGRQKDGSFEPALAQHAAAEWKSGRLPEALNLYTYLFHTYQNPRYHWPLADIHLRLHQPLEAQQELDAYAAGVEPQFMAPGQQVADIERMRELVRGQLVRLRVRADQDNAPLYVDGRAIGRSPLGQELELDPGSHRVEARGSRVAVQQANFGPGQQLSLELMTRPPRPGPGLTVSKWVFVVSGVVALGAGAALLAFNGTQRCQPLPVGCSVQDNTAVGAPLVALVGAAVIGAGVMFLLDLWQRRKWAGTATYVSAPSSQEGSR